MTQKTKNNRGDIPIMVLIIGVFALCTVAIVSFIVSGKINRADDIGIEATNLINSKIEAFHFYVNLGFSETEAAQRIGARIEDDIMIVEEKSYTGIPRKEYISVEYRRKISPEVIQQPEEELPSVEEPAPVPEPEEEMPEREEIPTFIACTKNCGITPADKKGCALIDRSWMQTHGGKGCNTLTGNCYDNGWGEKQFIQCPHICEDGECSCKQTNVACLRDKACCDGLKCFILQGGCKSCVPSGTIVYTIRFPHRSNCCKEFYCSKRGFLGGCTEQKCS